jgi:hypothetical protein
MILKLPACFQLSKLQESRQFFKLANFETSSLLQTSKTPSSPRFLNVCSILKLPAACFQLSKLQPINFLNCSVLKLPDARLNFQSQQSRQFFKKSILKLSACLRVSKKFSSPINFLN